MPSAPCGARIIVPYESKFIGIEPSQTGEGHMKRLEKEELKAKLYELCPEIEQLGLYPIVLGKGNRY